MQKNRQTYLNKIPSYAWISRYQEYWRLVEWMATPTPLRKPTTLTELAKELSVHNTTLSRWQLADGFYRDVRQRIKHELRGDLSNVFYSLRNRIFKDGSAKEVKLFLQWVDDFVEKHEIEHKGEIKTSPELQQLAREFDEKLKSVLAKKEI